ncbi:hypothetical protein [Hydrogenothermus marinus]|uniref:DUF397 domain-containing protein n=1 Tax=Hydrogenothermus marinus TaxID=133270 RepID=A0A3M0BC53_9AQUI|nr:hypothetical protein [Hydrogenothermus marinus]RMA92488.1 hypothetical protein CLV39_1644 [Hydrogenothermus marinus]
MEIIKKLTLCSSAHCCPDIEIIKNEKGESEVILKENDDKIVLNKHAWNLLVKLIKEGELKEL